jgi:hypothetical protein
MTSEVNLKKERKRWKFKLPWIFILAWGIPLIILFTGLLNSGDGNIDLPESPGKIIGGSIAFDGRYYWATRILLSFGAEIKREIVKFDPKGDVCSIFTPTHDFRGLAYDGEQLWTADAVGSEDFLNDDGGFYIIDQESGQFVKKFSIQRDYMVDGLAASRQALWVLGRTVEQPDKVFLWEIDPHIKSITNEAELSDELIISCSGITFLNGYVWALVGSAEKEVLKISPHDGRIVKRYDFSGDDINGITNNGNQIFIADGGEHQLLVLDTGE